MKNTPCASQSFAKLGDRLRGRFAAAGELSRLTWPSLTSIVCVPFTCGSRENCCSTGARVRRSGMFSIRSRSTFSDGGSHQSTLSSSSSGSRLLDSNARYLFLSRVPAEDSAEDLSGRWGLKCAAAGEGGLCRLSSRDSDDMGRHESHRMRREPQNESWASFLSFSAYTKLRCSQNLLYYRHTICWRIQYSHRPNPVLWLAPPFGSSITVLFKSYSCQSHTLEKNEKKKITRSGSSRQWAAFAVSRSRATGSRRDVHVGVGRDETF